jgi:predicted nuclease of restriction endonuclease-like RecB superfamily
MLTKDHLLVRRRSGKIFPQYIDPEAADYLEAAKILIELFEDSIGLTVGDLEDAAQDLGLSPPIPLEVVGGLTKLCMDRLELREDDGSAEEFRWQMIEKSEALRQSPQVLDQKDFEQRLSQAVDLDIDTIRDRLYNDLPENRTVLGWESNTPEALLHRWNCAQVQGLLLRATSVKVLLPKISLKQKRTLFRQLKFHRLLSTVEETTKKSHSSETSDFEFELSGPLSLFEQGQNYGLRIANFFPYILHFESYQLEAEVKWQNELYQFHLNQKSGIKSHYKNHEQYIPDELTACLNHFNQKNHGIKANVGETFVHIGRESYCFPDISLSYLDTAREIHIELFHRWHIKQLRGRLEALAKNPINDLKIGVCRSLAKELETDVGASEWFKKNGFWFRDFPTAQSLAQLLKT